MGLYLLYEATIFSVFFNFFTLTIHGNFYNHKLFSFVRRRRMGNGGSGQCDRNIGDWIYPGYYELEPIQEKKRPKYH
jgi:hypothetical protein